MAKHQAPSTKHQAPSTKRQAAVLRLGVVIGGIGLLYPGDIELLGLAFVDAAQHLRGPHHIRWPMEI
ncbi:hypothetical protein [Prochlorococcus sp. MIT 1201]|uniref:hypothetical protein n=1 Tax=Prochlorococcus sp. MIT 1201 TaxID=3082535 RepID=UPI0039A6BAF6